MESLAIWQGTVLRFRETGEGGFCASSYPGNRLKVQYCPLPIIEVVVNNTVMTALVDTGCTTTLINSRLMSGCGRRGTVKAVDGRDIKCKGARQVEIKVRGVRVKVEVILMNRIIDRVDVIIGMDVINEMGGVIIKKAEVKFGDVHCAMAAQWLNVCKIEDKDFEANFDGEKWTGEPPVLQNRVKFYKNSLESEKNSEFEEEVERWITDGILIPFYFSLDLPCVFMCPDFQQT